MLRFPCFALKILASKAKQATLAGSKIGAEATEIHKCLGKQKPRASTGSEACFASQRHQARRLGHAGAPISTKELQAATKAASASSSIYAKNTLKGALSKAKATEAARARSSPGCMAGGAAACERFTASFLQELKNIEPGSRASRGRASYLSAGGASPVQEGLGTLCESQEILQGQLTSWIPARGKGERSEALSKKRAKEAAKEAAVGCSAGFMRQRTPAPASKGGASRGAPQRKKGSSCKRSGKGGKSWSGRKKIGRAHV